MKKEEYNYNIRYINEDDFCINFDEAVRTIKAVIDLDIEIALDLNVKELQAINEKCKELGWLDE